MPKRKIFFLVGPTAVGKTETAIFLAEKLNAEIISCDSMQIYKGMNVVTSKPTKAQRKIIMHHLIDELPINKEYDVSLYRKAAIEIMEVIFKRDKSVFFVGGTGLYVTALIEGIFEIKAQDDLLRKELYNQAQTKGKGYLYKKLRKVDPKASAKIHPNDLKRIIRALEVFKITGKPISELQKLREGLGKKYKVVMLGLNMDREDLYKRIDERVDEMFARGLVAEVKKILRSKISKTAYCAIGIKEVQGYLNKEYGLERARYLMKLNTRHYAKRQLTWFRKDKRISWIKVQTEENPQRIANKIWKKLY